MSDTTVIILIGTGFRTACLACGLGFAYLGYRLYIKGITEKEGMVAAQGGSGRARARVLLKNVAPGVVFAVFGLCCAAIGVIRPISIEASLQPIRVVTQEQNPKLKSEGQPPKGGPPVFFGGQKDITTKPSEAKVPEAIIAKLEQGGKLGQAVQLTPEDAQQLVASISALNQEIEWYQAYQHSLGPLLNEQGRIQMTYQFNEQKEKNWWEFWK